MNNLAIQENTNLMMWSDQEKLQEIRKLFAPKLADIEFQFFVGLGKATGLNPFTREIWAVKYRENEPAQVFIGRDGYRKAAQAHHEYDYHQPDAVYENDIFQVVDGEVRHSYNLSNRGNLVGAYCIAKRKSSSKPVYVFAELKEYSTGKSLWRDSGMYKNDKGYMSQGGKPATMIKKVAESQCLRACFQDLFGGTYGEEEMDVTEINHNTQVIIEGKTQTEKLKSILNIENQEIESQDEKMADENQLNEIHFLMTEHGFDDERKGKAYKYFGIESLDELGYQQAEIFIGQLGKLSN